MAVQANVTNNQISASVSETQINVAVSGGVGPTGSPGPQGPASASVVESVNGQTGTVVLTITDLTAAAAVHTHGTSDVVSFAAAAAAAAPVQSVAGRTGAISLAAADVAGLANVAVSGSYTSLANVPTSFAPATHTHAISEVSGLQTSLDGKAAAGATNVSRVETLNGLTGTLSIVAGQNVTVSTSGSSITIAAGGGGGGAVASVNGQTGTVFLTAADVTAASETHANNHGAGGTDQLYDQGLNQSDSPTFNTLSLTGDRINFSNQSLNFLHTGSSEEPYIAVGKGSNEALMGLRDGEMFFQASQSIVRIEKTGGGLADIRVERVRLQNDNKTSAEASFSPAALTGLRTYTLPDANGTVVVSTSSPSSGQSLVWDGSAWAAASAGGAVASVNGQTGTVTLTTTDLTAAAATHATTHRAGGSDEILPLVTAVALTASVNNYSLPTGDVFRLSHSGTNTINITGLATAADGAARLLLNVSTSGTSTYTLKHQDTNSTAVSRLIVPWAGDYVLSPNGGAALVIYDSTDSRWRVV